MSGKTRFSEFPLAFVDTIMRKGLKLALRGPGTCRELSLNSESDMTVSLIVTPLRVITRYVTVHTYVGHISLVCNMIYLDSNRSLGP